jgi:hypothetical protein
MPSVDWISREMWNDNDTTVNMFLTIYVKLKKQLNYCDRLDSQLAVKNSFIGQLLYNEENSYVINIDNFDNNQVSF